MGSKKKYYDEDERFAQCSICDEEIAIEYYMDRGDIVSCGECETDYVIKSRNPVILSLLEDDGYDNDDYDEDNSFNLGYD